MSAYFIRSSSRSSFLQSSLPTCRALVNQILQSSPSSPPLSRQFTQTRSRTTEATAPSVSPFVSNVIRILRTEIEYQSEYAPPAEPVTSFRGFAVEECAGSQYVRLKGKFGDTEDIKIEATMFDGGVCVPKPGDDSDGEDIRLHISVLVDISKREGFGTMEFVCSAWPDWLEIQKIYYIPHDGLPSKAHMGPNYSDLDYKLQKALSEYLEVRGLTNDLSAFLHSYMMNKDRTELIRWLGAVESFMQR